MIDCKIALCNLFRVGRSPTTKKKKMGQSFNTVNDHGIRPRYMPVKCYPCNSVNFAVYVLQEYDPARAIMILKNKRLHQLTKMCYTPDPSAHCDFYHHFFLPYKPSPDALGQHISEVAIVEEVKAKHNSKGPVLQSELWKDIRGACFKRMYAVRDEAIKVEGDKIGMMYLEEYHKSLKRKVEDVDDEETLTTDDCIHFKLSKTQSTISPSK